MYDHPPVDPLVGSCACPVVPGQQSLFRWASSPRGRARRASPSRRSASRPMRVTIPGATPHGAARPGAHWSGAGPRPSPCSPAQRGLLPPGLAWRSSPRRLRRRYALRRRDPLVSPAALGGQAEAGCAGAASPRTRAGKPVPVSAGKGDRGVSPAFRGFALCSPGDPCSTHDAPRGRV